MTLYFKLNQNAIDRRHTIHFLTFDMSVNFQTQNIISSHIQKKMFSPSATCEAPKKKNTGALDKAIFLSHH